MLFIIPLYLLFLKFIDYKEIELVSGGFIKYRKTGTYIVCGESDDGQKIRIAFEGKPLRDAVDFDFPLFKKQYKEMGISDADELEGFYIEFFKILSRVQSNL